MPDNTPYVNPVPMIDAGKRFSLRLELTFPELVEVEAAKLRAAEYLLSQDAPTVASWFHCLNIKPIYPKDLTPKERAALGIPDDDGHAPGDGT